MMKNWLIDSKVSLRDALTKIEIPKDKILFVVLNDNTLAGSLTDGDIRRWLIDGGSLEASVIEACNKNPYKLHNPINKSELTKILKEKSLKGIPLVDINNRIIKIYSLHDITDQESDIFKGMLDIPAIIMAGGRGKRLEPLTNVLPKPLIPIGDKPIIDIIINNFRNYGISDFYITLNHKAEMIKSYFEEYNHGVKISFIIEDFPLGTAGSLKTAAQHIEKNFFLSNCDVIIDTDYHELLHYHCENNYDITIVVSMLRYRIPYGICTMKERGEMHTFTEKPEYDLLINTGFYVINKHIIKLIPDNKQIDMPDLISEAQKQNHKIGLFPIAESGFFDIGQWHSLQKTNKHYNT